MGQQQLLLMSLSIVLIGGVVVIGAHAFKGESPSKNHTRAIQEAHQIIGRLHAWKAKPSPLGGGSSYQGFHNITFRTLGYRPSLLSNRVYKTDIGCYQLQTIGEGHDAQIKILPPTCTETSVVATVVIKGEKPYQVEWQTPTDDTLVAETSAKTSRP